MQTYTPTKSCPISKVEFVPQINGQLKLMVTVDLKVFNDTSSSNGDYYFDLTVKNKTTNGIVAGQQG